jgi:cytochrome b pre-mRNA-processing protein 3
MSRTSSYIAYNQTALLFAACSAPGAYTLPAQPSTLFPADRAPDIGVGTGFWYESLHLQPTFNTWAQISFLHMWLVMTRLRGIGEKEGGVEVVRRYAQLLYDHFSHAAEDRMEGVHGIVSKSVRARYIKDLFTQWRGVVAAYDQGLVRGDAELGAAVWRNLWGGVGMEGGEGGKVDWRGVAVVVGWMRRVVQQLSEIKSQDMVLAVVQRGEIFKVSEDEKSLLVSNR